MHIVIVNAHWNNRGDEAAHRPLWEELLRRYPDCRITVMFKDRLPVTWVPRMENMEFFSCQFKAATWDIWLVALTRGMVGKNSELKKAVRTLRTADLIIYPPGGSVINDRFFWSKQMEYLVPFLCARLYGIQMFVAAPSIGPFDPEKPRRLRKWLLETPKVFCVRESISAKYLKAIGISENVHVTRDLAFTNDVDSKANQKQLDECTELKEFLQSHEKTVGITISDFKWHVVLGKNLELTKQIEGSFQYLIDFLTKKGYGVLLIPQLFGNQHDVDYLQVFATNSTTFTMSEDLDTNFQQYVVSKLHALVGMRYHSNIFAAKMGIPFIAVVYEEKMKGFLESAGLTEYSIPVEEVSSEILEEKFSTLESDHEELAAKLREDAASWRKAALKTIELLPSAEELA